MTIEERAKAYASGKFDEISSTAGYIKGATEQKAIDKKLIYDIIEETVGFIRRQYPDAEDSEYWEVVYKAKEHIEDFRKAMEE